MKKIELSLIVPVYNVEKYLETCLKSLYSLKNIEKEIIIVNDESPDFSYKIIDKYKNLFPEKTLVVNKKNGGVASARNLGLSIARGRYVAFIDSDDWIDDKKYEEFIRKVLNDDVEIGLGNAKFYYGDDNNGYYGQDFKRDKKIKDNKIKSGEDFFIDSTESDSFRVEIWDNLFKREFLLSNNLKFNESILHEDLQFSVEAMLKAKKVKYYDIQFYFYRQRSGSYMHSKSLKNYKDLIKIASIILSKIKNSNNKKLQELLFLDSYKICKHSLSYFYKNDKKEFEIEYKIFKKNYGNHIENKKLNISIWDRMEIRSYCCNYSFGKRIGKITRFIKRNIRKFTDLMI